MALVTKSFSDIITFTRASTGTFFNSAGVLTSAAINAPRFDYNPSTLAAQGLLIEEQRTNLLLRSEDFATTWTNAGDITVTVDVAISPSGNQTADKIAANATTNVHGVQQVSVAVSSGATYTFSCFAKAAGYGFVWFDLFDGSNRRTWFNLNNGTVGTNAAGSTASIQSVGNGWYRCVISRAVAAASVNAAILTSNADNVASFLGDGTSGIFIWGAQLEAGAFPTSYIPTTTTALTRSADVANVNTLAPWYNQSEGTLFVETTRSYTGNFVNFPHTAGLSDGTSNNVIWAGYAINGSQSITPEITSGGVDQFNFVTGTYSMTTAKNAIAYKTNDSQWFFNGAAFATDTTCTMPSGLNKLSIGSDTVNGQSWGGWIRRVTYYPRRLSQAEGIAITA